MTVKHEITLIAYQRCEDGNWTIRDIVETSRYYANSFARMFLHDPECHGIAAIKPGQQWSDANIRIIRA